MLLFVELNSLFVRNVSGVHLHIMLLATTVVASYSHCRVVEILGYI